MEARFDAKLAAMEARFGAKLPAMEEGFDGKLAALEERFDGKLAKQKEEIVTQLREEIHDTAVAFEAKLREEIREATSDVQRQMAAFVEGDVYPRNWKEIN